MRNKISVSKDDTRSKLSKPIISSPSSLASDFIFSDMTDKSIKSSKTKKKFFPRSDITAVAPRQLSQKEEIRSDEADLFSEDMILSTTVTSKKAQVGNNVLNKKVAMSKQLKPKLNVWDKATESSLPVKRIPEAHEKEIRKNFDKSSNFPLPKAVFHEKTYGAGGHNVPIESRAGPHAKDKVEKENDMRSSSAKSVSAFKPIPSFRPLGLPGVKKAVTVRDWFDDDSESLFISKPKK